MSAIIHVLNRPGMARLFLAQFLISGQLFLAFSTLPLYTEALGGNAFTIGIHTAIFTGVGLLLRFFLGPLADTHGRKPMLLLGAFVYATTNGLLLLSGNLTLLALVRGYQGIGLAAYPSASTAMVLDLAPPESRGTALSLSRGMMSLSLLVFPVGAQRLLDQFGFSALFLLGLALTTVAFVLLLSLPGAADQERRWANAITAAGRSGGPQRAGFALTRVLRNFAEMGRHSKVLAGLAAITAGVLTYMGATSFLPLSIRAQGGGDYGPFFLALGLGAFLAGFTGGLVDRYGSRNAILVAMTVSAAGAMFLSWRTTGPVLLLSGALIGSGFTMSMTAAPAWIDRIVPHRLRATAMAFTETGIDTGMVIGFPLLGALAASLGYPSVFVAMAVMSLAALLIVGRQEQGG